MPSGSWTDVYMVGAAPGDWRRASVLPPAAGAQCPAGYGDNTTPMRHFLGNDLI